MKRPLVIACAAAATLFAASAAEAGRVSWSVGINVPPVATVVASDPWFAAPVRYAPPAVVYPAPIVYEEPYVVAPRYYAPPVVVAPRARFWAPPHRGYWGHPVRARWHRGWHH
jgi:hypothetical protein